MLKLLFEWLVDPLGLPINPMYEYLIMLVVGELAYQFAYDKTGALSHKEYMNSGQKSIIHWCIRLIFYFSVWALLRIIIIVYGFVLDNKEVSLFGLGCIVAIIITVKISRSIEERTRLQKIRESYRVEKEEKEE